MADARSRAVLRQVHRLFSEGTVAGLGEGPLLERFVARRDEAAFEALVARHGPMVLAACRQVLRDPHDVEDAFQATFLVLARKAGSIRRADRLGPWLYRVARRAAERAKIGEARRRACEQRAAPSEAGSPRPDDPSELQPLLYEEVDRLPESYRAAIVLCYLQGQTHEEAARRLAWPVGTVRGRLARARSLLRERLTRRGVALSAGFSAAALLEESASAALPAGLVAAAVGAALGGASSVSGSASRLAEGILGGLAMTKLKVVAALGLTAVGVGLLAGRADGDPPQDRAGRPAGPAARVGQPAAPPRAGAGDERSPQEVDREIIDLTRQATEYRAKLAKIEADLRRLRFRQGAGAKVVTDDAPAPTDGGRMRTRNKPLPKYVVEPPDLLRIEALQVLPGRPLQGEFLIRPDGTISLGYYGDLYVSGLTLDEAKEKVISHLRKYVRDEFLGLILAKEIRDEKGNPVLDENGEPKTFLEPVQPKESDRVFVDIAAYNSKVYYVQGDFGEQGRFPITGNDTVLDAICYAGGLATTADSKTLRLIRPAPPGARGGQTLPIDYEAIVRRGDPTTDYQIMPGDRIVVDRLSEADLRAKGMDPAAVETKATGERLEALEKKMEEVLQELRARREPKPE